MAQVCYRLDGIPLAIELAAARTKVLSVEEISARLGDSFRLLAAGSRTALPRQRTLHATMDWSHELLGQKERVLFRRLSVFAGGFTLEAAESICAGEELQRDEVLELLSQLVDKSLVVAQERDGAARYRLLETIRQYGWERLEEAGEAAHVREQHAGYYLARGGRGRAGVEGRASGNVAGAVGDRARQLTGGDGVVAGTRRVGIGREARLGAVAVLGDTHSPGRRTAIDGAGVIGER